jgi:hypothetical protein
MALRGSDRIDDMDAEPRGADLVRTRRPWALIIASLLLVALAVVLWAKWSESRTEIERLRGELKVVYTEAEAIRTQAALAQQRVAILEKQVAALRVERSERGGDEPTGAKAADKPRAKATAKPSKTPRQITR